MNKVIKCCQNEQGCGGLCRNAKNHDFVKFCKKSATNQVEDENFKSFKDDIQEGKN